MPTEPESCEIPSEADARAGTPDILCCNPLPNVAPFA